MKKLMSFCFLAGSVAVVFSRQLAEAQPPDFPLRCRGSAGMASANGNNLIINFSRGERPADQGLQPGQCSWLDRGLRPNEPTRVVDQRPTSGEAEITARHINAGDTWTFWVFNAGRFLRATSSAKGMPKHKPQRIDDN
jgi:hypothetical protein